MSYLPMLGNHTAAKQYRCDAGFTCARAYGNPEHSKETPRNVIEPGDRYTAETYPPWSLTQEDPGSPVVKLGEWITHRFHVECYGGQYL